MSPRDYLSLLDDLRREIARREDRAASLRRMASFLAPKLCSDVRVQSSPAPDRMQTLVGEAVDEELAAARLRDCRAEMLLRLSLAISSLPDPQMIRLMELRYLEEQTWYSVIRAMHHSDSRVYTLHRLALDLLPDFPDPVIEPS